jgi:hypothetical protein
LALGDFDGDGRLDVLNSRAGGSVFGGGNFQGQVDLHLGNGDGTFQSGTFISNGSGEPLVVGDLNRDGRLDFLRSSSAFLGNGDGTFTTVHPGGAGRLLMDVNQDGRPDRVSASASLVGVHLGNGDGTFQAAQSYPAGPGAVDAAAGDFDGDGSPDLVVANDSSGVRSLSVLLNDGDWSAPPPPPPTPPSLSISDATVTEGSTGTVEVVFTVTLSAASAVPVTVNFATANGSALAASDYYAVLSRLTFEPGTTSKAIYITVVGDAVVEPDETLFVNLTSAGGATITDGSGIGTITNDDVASLPKLRISDVSKKEGRSGTTYFTFTVTLSAPSAVPVTVNYATANGAAKAGDDYTSASGALTFSPGQTSKTITIAVKGDSKKEANETFFINLSAATGAQIEDGQGIGTILNDD